jgi:SAM-dependent methyltransferase
VRRRYELLHQLGLAPWAGGEMPPQLRRLAQRVDAGGERRAVDLGCGTGEHARYLAAAGWSVTAVDFIAAAIATARRNDPGRLVDWRVADVTRAEEVDPGGELAGTVSLLLDIGCLHGFAAADRPRWAETVRHLATPEATLLVRAAPAGQRWPAPAGIDGPDIACLLGRSWRQRDAVGAWFTFEHHADGALPR